jgi:hypothetical protein
MYDWSRTPGDTLRIEPTSQYQEVGWRHLIRDTGHLSGKTRIPDL